MGIASILLVYLHNGWKSSIPFTAGKSLCEVTREPGKIERIPIYLGHTRKGRKGQTVNKRVENVKITGTPMNNLKEEG